MSENDIERARSALRALDSAVDRGAWVRIGMAARAAGIDFDEFNSWSSTAGNYGGEAETRSAWNSFAPDGGIGAGSLFHQARLAGWADTTPEPKPPRMGRNAAPTDLWSRGTEATAEHPYIVRKGGVPDGLRVVSWPLQGWARFKGRDLRGWLMVPSRDAGGELRSIQFIGPKSGEKLNFAGCKISEGTFSIGAVRGGEQVYIVEGVAHAWSIRAAAGHAAVVSFGASNIERAAAAIKATGAAPVIVPDRGKEDQARAIALRLGCRCAMLPGDLARGADVNDLHMARGADAVRACIASAAIPAANDTKPPVYDPATPLRTARDLIARRWQHDGQRTLHRAAGAFYSWRGTHYAELMDADIRATLYSDLDGAKRIVRGRDGREFFAEFNPNRSSVDGTVDALRAVANLPGDAHTRTCWLDGRVAPSAAEIVSMKNGLLHLPARRFMAHDPRFFTLNSLPFAYDADAPAPRAWLDFLASVWPGDQESIALLQRYVGYLIAQDASHHKILLLVGPPRSGKGTVARTITALLGKPNVAGPTLADFSRPFGLQQLIGKSAAIVGDARLSGRTDQSEVVERLLSISGEDTLTVDRKHREAWIGVLPTRLVVLTNELPRLSDASGALASRFLILKMRNSFLGREDRTLGDRIVAELPGIFRWALEGWDALQREGRFTMPASSAEAVRDLDELASPVRAFLRERCIVGAAQWVETGALFQAWINWCRQQGRDFTGTAQSFGRDLAAAVPGLTTRQWKTSRERGRKFLGIGLSGPAASDDIEGDSCAF